MARSAYNGSPSPPLSPPKSSYLSDSSDDIDPQYLDPRQGAPAPGTGPGSSRSGGVDGSVDGEGGGDADSEVVEAPGEVEVVKS